MYNTIGSEQTTLFEIIVKLLAYRATVPVTAAVMSRLLQLFLGKLYLSVLLLHLSRVYELQIVLSTPETKTDFFMVRKGVKDMLKLISILF